MNISALARKFGERRHEIVDRWIAEVCQHTGCGRLPREDVVDNLPKLLDELIERLQARVEGRPDPGKTTIAQEHARQRLGLGIPLADVVREYVWLRKIFFDLAWNETPDITPKELDVVHSCLDEALFVSVETYSRETNLRSEDRLKQELEHAIELRDRLFGIVSHDLRSPLNAITLTATLILRHPDNPEPRVRRILAASDRASRLIRDLLDYTKAEVEGKLPVAAAPMRLDELAKDVVDEVQAVHPERTITLEDGVPIPGTWDRDRLAQVLHNLIDNALKHSKPDAAVVIRCLPDGRDAVVDVENEGEPIPDEELRRLFEPFVRGGGAVEKEGVGLGLYISRELVHAHGGSIEVSCPTGRVRFRIRLPIRAFD